MAVKFLARLPTEIYFSRLTSTLFLDCKISHINTIVGLEGTVSEKQLNSKVGKGSRFIFFCSRQIIVTKVGGREKRQNETFESGMMLRSADEAYKMCAHMRNVNF